MRLKNLGKAPRAPPEAMEGKGKKGEESKGKKGGWVENTSGKGMPSGAGGGGSAVWRQNMRALMEFHNPGMDVGMWLLQLCLYTQSHTGINKEDWESSRMFLQRVKKQLAPGLGWGGKKPPQDYAQFYWDA